MHAILYFAVYVALTVSPRHYLPGRAVGACKGGRVGGLESVTVSQAAGGQLLSAGRQFRIHAFGY
jgi:hypothetical protein